MLRKDKIKAIIILILLSIMMITYYFVGKESNIMKTVAGLSLIIWLVTIFILNKKTK